MEETTGAQYAIQVAVCTLRNRCQTLQQRVEELEEENRTLQVRLTHHEDLETSLSENDRLRRTIADLTEQRNQLHRKCTIVIRENDELWSKLSQMSKVKNKLDSEFQKISMLLAQHSADQEPLTKSMTIDFDEVELDLNRFGYSYGDDLEEQDEMQNVVQEVDLLFGEVLEQREFLQKHICLLESLKEDRKKNDEETNKATKKFDDVIDGPMEKICPICSINCSEDNFATYQDHVESHFVDTESFMMV